METRASYLLVGTFVLVLFAGLIGFVLWLAKFQAERQFTQYDVYFGGSVAGLKEGASVTYRGISVGQVLDMRIDPTNVERILVTIEVSANTPIRENTKASLALQAITGGAQVLLSEGTHASPPLRKQPGRKRAVIAAKASELEKLLKGAPLLVERVDLLVQQVSDLLNAKNRAAVTRTLHNFAELSDTIAARREDLSSALSSAAATLDRIGAASESLNRLSLSLETQLPKTLANANATLAAFQGVGSGARKSIDDLRGAARAIEAAGNEMRDLLAENRAPIRDFSNTGLYEFSSFLSELRTLVASLNRVTTEVGRDPARFIFGSQQDGYETQ